MYKNMKSLLAAALPVVLAVATISETTWAAPTPAVPPARQRFTGVKPFMPQNRLHLQDKGLRNANMTEQEFNQIIDQVINTFQPVAKAFGAQLVSEKKWSDSTVNAYATQSGNIWKVAMFGGLARRPEVTADGFAMVVCHELGHHLAGYPYYDSRDWAAAEGSSDYFATQICARMIWGMQQEVNRGFVRRFANEIPAQVRGACDNVWKGENERGWCYRAALAGHSLATLLSQLENGKAPDFGTPDPTQVQSTNTEHPAAQCRLDTYFAGALCAKKGDLRVIPGRGLPEGQNSAKAEQISAQQSCYREDGFAVGARPACWFKSMRAKGLHR